MNKCLLGRFLVSLFHHSKLFIGKPCAWGVQNCIASPVSSQAEQKSQSNGNWCGWAEASLNLTDHRKIFCNYEVTVIVSLYVFDISNCVSVLHRAMYWNPYHTSGLRKASDLFMLEFVAWLATNSVFTEVRMASTLCTSGNNKHRRCFFILTK